MEPFGTGDGFVEGVSKTIPEKISLRLMVLPNRIIGYTTKGKLMFLSFPTLLSLLTFNFLLFFLNYRPKSDAVSFIFSIISTPNGHLSSQLPHWMQSDA